MQNTPHRNKKVLIILDILMVLAILSFIGAFTITKYLAVKKQPEVKIYETNPVAVATTDLAAPPQPQRALMYVVFFGYLFRFVMLGGVLGWYIYHRHHADSDRKILYLCLCVSVWFCMLFLNFWNDFGLLLGKVI